MPWNALRIASLVAVVALTTACAGPSSSTAPTPGAATAAPTPARVAVTLTDAMRIEPDPITVPAGQAVTFVVTNSGAIPHEFTIGDADVQDEHEQEMLEMGWHGPRRGQLDLGGIRRV